MSAGYHDGRQLISDALFQRSTSARLFGRLFNSCRLLQFLPPTSVVYFSRLFQSFKHGGDTLPHTDTHRGKADLTILLLHNIQQSRGDTRT